MSEGRATDRLLAPVVAVAALAVIGVGVGTIVVRQTRHHHSQPVTALPGPTTTTPGAGGSTPTPGGPSGSGDTSAAGAGAAVDDYYAALERGDARSAFALLCAGQASIGYTDYAANYGVDMQTGTAIAGWRRTADVQAQLGTAFVKGTVTLADKAATPITVQLTLEPAGWRVCSSDLGGVLPAPGQTTASPTSSAT